MLYCKVFLFHEVFKLEFGAEPKNLGPKFFRIYLPGWLLIFFIFGGKITISLFLLYIDLIYCKKK